ncbi:uncharacterized protein CEXT_381641 [Caerostris extrusa]|uniref:Ig-like domain-containing protein n=1 Tax=Caerostris extrusa TaxID=172846 RepID=A0AAV4WFL3_CAEEX|nr:uncharacterized protein CEXT_381641 [Caerostris extrusa]
MVSPLRRPVGDPLQLILINLISGSPLIAAEPLMASLLFRIAPRRGDTVTSLRSRSHWVAISVYNMGKYGCIEWLSLLRVHLRPALRHGAARRRADRQRDGGGRAHLQLQRQPSQRHRGGVVQGRQGGPAASPPPCAHQRPEGRTPPPHRPSNKLVLNGILRSEAGAYTCHVRNAFGRGNSSNIITVDVLYPPTVRVGVTPSVAAESSEAVLTCEPVDGNPALLMSVRWHHDGDPVAGVTGEATRFTLRNLTREQSGNYTCKGLNTAGWSQDSEPKYLDIHYPPGSASISQVEATAVKGHTVTLSCKLDDAGHPPASRFLWESPTRTLATNASSNQELVMTAVNASAEGVYFCAGRNDVGTGPLGHFSLKLSGKFNLCTN